MADYNSKYSGEQVEALLDQVASGNAGGGGGGGIAVETDPVFSASPAASITNEKIAEWDNKYSKPSGGIPKSALAEDVQASLINAESYKGTVTGVKFNNSTKMPTDGVVDLGTVGTYSKPSTGIPKSDLNPSVQTSLGKADTAVQPGDLKDEVYIADFTIESLRDGIYNGINVDCDVQRLVNAMNANKIILVREGEDSSYKGVYVLNGYAEDLLYFSITDVNGNIYCCDGTDYIFLQGIDAQSLRVRNWEDKQDTLKSGENIKTINGESIVGRGNIEIGGGSGEVGPQGPQGDKGDKGDKGDTGVGVQSVTQTTTSNADGGSNVVTVTLTNGTKSTFTVKNGSKGSSGSNGTNGKDGADGATFTPSVDSAGNLSWTNNKGLTNPPTVNIKGPKGDKGDAGSGGGKEIIVSNGQSIYFDETSPMQANTTYIYSGSLFVSNIQAFEVASNYDEYHIIFRWPESGFAIPDDVKFANGKQPNIEYDTVCELHIVGVTMGETRVYNAVLTPFK